MQENAKRQKDIPLEAVRGVAAVTVLLWHSMLGFFPGLSGNFVDLGEGVAGQPWSGLLYGLAAVDLFFVLSGFVLTRAFFLTGDRSIITRGALKRWPRLAGPVLIAVLGSYLLWRFGLYHYDQAAALTHSPWLKGHLFQAAPVFPVKLLDAIAQGVFFTFFKENSAYFDTVLWTMRWEFIGSFIAFGLALLIQPMRRRERLLLSAVVLLLTHFAAPQLVPFIVGVALAGCLPERRSGHGLKPLLALLAAIYLAGYRGLPVGSYAWMLRVLGPQAPATYPHTLGAALLIWSIESSLPLRRLLSWRASEWLGRLSFPLYLVHIPILCSLGSMAVIATRRGIAGAVVTIVLSFAAAVPLMWFNEWWVAWLNRMLSPAPPPPGARRCGRKRGRADPGDRVTQLDEPSFS